MLRNKKVLLLVALIGLIVFLSGCTQIDQPITPESTGIWNKYFVYPLSQVITFFADLFNSSYGLAIVVVTLIIRLVLVPLNVKQIKSTKAMQEVQPEIQALQKKYSSKDANTQQKLQQETMALFQKHGVNPLAGCLPIFIQMPILIAMYHAIMRTEAIKEGSFLWFELGAADPLHILPIIAGGATFFQQKLMMADNAAVSQNPQMKVMLYVMPIMITVFAFMFPAALALYWVVGNVFMVAQTLFIRNPMMKDASTGGEKK
ncbi:YidC family membrane integrase SpoIIIJ [Virgibacillus sp. MSJ-26]|uniref:YidC family membrane integrase SpoIIIJ n=1 Tax=Virgibacillus sp. MSJ-26 TaxID=2841522 RepID=UPI001C118466|nr:YidC family membrane integrase SpoIIIJ [Virgibacillus sp. MSJ-26]MBU5467463.1 YidC family membrane integrase SpoIIIJ [Virgibacillus sp. MSJ-26]